MSKSLTNLLDAAFAPAPRRPTHSAKVVFDVYRDAKNEWRWRAWARNGKIIANSGEGYKRRGDCLKIANDMRGVSFNEAAAFPLFIEGVLQ